MGKQSSLIKRQQNSINAAKDATTQTIRQYMTDMLILTLNDSEVMGKDVFGYKRIEKVVTAALEKYDLYFDALTAKEEADYCREKIDIAMRKVIPEDKFTPFQERYDWLPKITYGRRK